MRFSSSPNSSSEQCPVEMLNGVFHFNTFLPLNRLVQRTLFLVFHLWWLLKRIEDSKPKSGTELLIYQSISQRLTSMLNLFDKIPHLSDREIRQMLAEFLCWNKSSTFNAGPYFTCPCNYMGSQ